ncbi:MAG: energy transducer TonB [Desulfobulbaceae bacterium]|nr:energy transducer TonB [Desulfobulbaceae bacterium]
MEATLINTSRGYQEVVGRRHVWLHRLGTIIIALTINGVLFILMPTLLHLPTDEPQFTELVPAITVIRLPKPDDPVKKQTPQPPEPKPQPKPPEPAPPKPLLSKPKLPFAVNPLLPEGPPELSLSVDLAKISFTGGSDIFSAAQLDAPLLVTTRIPPVYPHRARHRRIEGWVRVEFVVHEDGSVGEVVVKESQPAGIFDAPVISAVSGWRFRAGTIAGVPVKAKAETTVRFQLDQ